MKIDQELSERVGVLRFPLIVGVVFVHAYGAEVGFASRSVGKQESSYVVDFVFDFISQGVARISVPVLFLIAGYFFFIGFSFDAYKDKLRSRVRSLLLPFLIWNVFVLFLLFLGQEVSVTSSFFSGKNAHVSEYNIFEYINATLGIDRSPAAYQFWFIRDLMILVIISPVMYIFLNLAPKSSVVFLFSLWFLDFWLVYVPSIAAFLFFFLGAYLAKSDTSLFAFDRFGSLFIVTYILVLLVDVLTKGMMINEHVHRVGILFGILSVLYLSGFVVKVGWLKRFLLWSGTFSFFVFASHEPLLTAVKKIIYIMFEPNADLFVIFLYFIIPVFVIVFCIISYLILKAVAPRFLSVVSGGR